MLRALQPALGGWLGDAGARQWLDATAGLAPTHRLFLEFHPAAQRRCDIVTRAMASDGTLDGWITRTAARKGQAWCDTGALLRSWRQQLDQRRGMLHSNCFLMWLEFDLDAASVRLGDPSLFIALTPGTDAAALASGLAAYPKLEAAVRDFDRLTRTTRLHRDVISANPVTLGHLGYMASRGSGRLPLRNCWRCETLDHVGQVLEAAGLDDHWHALAVQLDWVDTRRPEINSLMLHLDSDRSFRPDFSLEVNVFSTEDARSGQREAIVLGDLVERGLVTTAQVESLTRLSGRYAAYGSRFTCSLHHFKLALSGARVTGAKCYWLVRTDHIG